MSGKNAAAKRAADGPVLVIAEKPSVAQSIAKVLGAYKRNDGYMEGNGYFISWCYGHLAEYAMPEAYDERYAKWNFEDLPIIPAQWKMQVAEDKKAQVEVLKKLFSRASEAVNACDAGREGELIFRHVYELAKTDIPIRRLWISSMEDAAIREGLRNLRDGAEYENLYAAAVCRAKADWLVGMNATRAFSTKYHARITVGRVQSPTLAMIVERQHRIDHFQKEISFRAQISGAGLTAVSEPISDEAACDSIAAKCRGSEAVVSSVDKQEKRSAPPKLYDLTTLQREANRFFGFTAQETLDELQKMYEAKLVTYPRTDSRYITADMEGTAEELVSGVPELLDSLAEGAGTAGTERRTVINTFAALERTGRANVHAVINDQKVSDHHALLPTKAAFSTDMNRLPQKQKNLLGMIAARLAAAVSSHRVTEETKVVLSCCGTEFSAKGTIVIQPGFGAVEDAFRKAFLFKGTETAGETGADSSGTDDGGQDSKKDVTGSISENIAEGMTFRVVDAVKKKHYTSPPKPYTEDSLLAAMEQAGAKEMDDDAERKGLGTPATRAGVIEKLAGIGYIIRKGKQLLPTDRGIKVVEILPDRLKAPEFTAEWENMLLAVERGEVGREEFLAHIADQVDEVLEGLSSLPENSGAFSMEREIIGICPACSNPVVAGKGNFHCSNRSCRFIFWDDNHYLSSMKAEIDRRTAEALLKDGRVHMKGLYSQGTGKSFDADLLLSAGEDGRAIFSIKYPETAGKMKKDKRKRNERKNRTNI